MNSTLAPIPEGWFLMGSEHGRKDERPIRRVWVDTFEMAVYPVSNRDYGFFLAETGYSPPARWNDPAFRDPDQPVVAVNWRDAMSFCRWLTESTGKHFTLPTEAQWEKAARGGKEQLDYPWGDDPLPTEGKYDLGLKDEHVGRPERMGQGTPNGFGLHHMADLVHEWSLDYYDERYYQRSPTTNPLNTDRSIRRSARGGAWRHRIKYSRCAARSSLPEDRYFDDFGFRVVATVD